MCIHCGLRWLKNVCFFKRIVILILLRSVFCGTNKLCHFHFPNAQSKNVSKNILNFLPLYLTLKLNRRWSHFLIRFSLAYKKENIFYGIYIDLLHINIEWSNGPSIHVHPPRQTAASGWREVRTSNSCNFSSFAGRWGLDINVWPWR